MSLVNVDTKQYNDEDFLEPFSSVWDEDRFIVAVALSKEMAEFLANHEELCDGDGKRGLSASPRDISREEM